MPWAARARVFSITHTALARVYNAPRSRTGAREKERESAGQRPAPRYAPYLGEGRASSTICTLILRRLQTKRARENAERACAPRCPESCCTLGKVCAAVAFAAAPPCYTELWAYTTGYTYTRGRSGISIAARHCSVAAATSRARDAADCRGSHLAAAFHFQPPLRAMLFSPLTPSLALSLACAPQRPARTPPLHPARTIRCLIDDEGAARASPRPCARVPAGTCG